MMIVKLGNGERLNLIGMMNFAPPVKGDITKIKIIREFKENLSFTESEHAEMGIKSISSENDPNIMSYKWDRTIPKEFEISEVIHEVIKKAISFFNEKEILEERHFTIYEKFMEQS